MSMDISNITTFSKSKMKEVVVFDADNYISKLM
jgi:hypothetical protein